MMTGAARTEHAWYDDDDAPRDLRGSVLTKNETLIIAALAEGKQSKEIAGCVKLSKASIDTYVRILYGKLDARSRAHLVARAYALRILPPP